ncbi:MAG: GAP family protein [Mycobacteriaceae bacterium]|nr:GAP family protein [Mycobacteriaceae bacterium]
MLSISGAALAKLAATASVVALAPIPVVLVLVLLVHSERPRSASIAYLSGRLLALTAVTVAFLRVPEFFDAIVGPAPPWTDWSMLAVGVALIGLGWWVWRRRNDIGRRPCRQSRVGRLSPPVSAAIGILPTMANPKVIAASAAAGGQIGNLDLSAIGTAAAVGCYAVVASSTIAAPIAAYLVVGPQIGPQLDRIRSWVHRRQRAVTALAAIALGVAALMYGFA